MKKYIYPILMSAVFITSVAVPTIEAEAATNAKETTL